MSTLSDEVQKYIAEIKELETKMLDLINQKREGVQPDPRWASIARTHFQEGRMSLVRSVTEK